MKNKALADKSIAVLPFLNLSADPELEYFSDGITEEILNALAQVNTLKVTSRTSSFYFKGKNIPLKEIARQLNVAIILEGSVRIASDKVRIKAQLIDAAEDSHFWSETWDRKLENIFEIQDEVSLQIADKLREQLGHIEFNEHLVEKQTNNLDAYSQYLKALFHFNKWNPEDVSHSIKYFEDALAIDPRFTEALIGLADAYSFMGTTEAFPREEAFMKTVEFTHRAHALNPNNAGVHYQLANLSFFTDCNFDDAMKHVNHALQLKPSYPEGLQFKSFLHILRGEMDTAHRYLQLALGIDPLNFETLFYKGYYLYRNKDYPEALKIVSKILENNPKNIPSVILYAYCKLKTGEYNEVLEYIDNTLSQTLLPDEKLGISCLAFILKGDVKTGREILRQVQAEAKKRHSFQAHSYLFLAYVSLNEFDKAFACLDTALDMKSSIVMLTFSDPLAENLREDIRFAGYKKKMYKITATEEVSTEKAPLLDEQTAAKYSNELFQFMENEKPYLNPSLTLRILAEFMEYHPNKLSWLLNEKVGKKFNEFVNGYRLEHFKQIARNPENQHISILGLAYESGFNSKTVFNTFFKKSEGITPIDYLKTLK